MPGREHSPQHEQPRTFTWPARNPPIFRKCSSVRHPVGELLAAEAAAEAVAALLIDVHLGDGAGGQVHEQLRVAHRRTQIGGRRQKKRRRKVLQRSPGVARPTLYTNPI